MPKAPNYQEPGEVCGFAVDGTLSHVALHEELTGGVDDSLRRSRMNRLIASGPLTQGKPAAQLLREFIRKHKSNRVRKWTTSKETVGMSDSATPGGLNC